MSSTSYAVVVANTFVEIRAFEHAWRRRRCHSAPPPCSAQRGREDEASGAQMARLEALVSALWRPDPEDGQVPGGAAPAAAEDTARAESFDEAPTQPLPLECGDAAMTASPPSAPPGTPPATAARASSRTTPPAANSAADATSATSLGTIAAAASAPLQGETRADEEGLGGGGGEARGEPGPLRQRRLFPALHRRARPEGARAGVGEVGGDRPGGAPFEGQPFLGLAVIARRATAGYLGRKPKAPVWGANSIAGPHRPARELAQTWPPRGTQCMLNDTKNTQHENPL
eukprot:CAMPEP_0176314314 /NCGR_PEP_ID=MMETSP0121_2-20121125/67621_1 /TAXON_ID=160619 /ORGANISM="Kryptoperidinium foliaceum, Strain CCMP 1326" /LENGTH=286 /DNA_ID=CAMNT_0017656425 /DNA_START=54 /DNA_END=916 /DNA_ORIENTATION=+